MNPSNPVRLAVYDEGMVASTGPTLCVAFATTDVCVIDEHFGSASRFATYRVWADRDELLGVTPFPQSEHDGNEGRLAGKIAAIEGCAAVFCQAVGGSAVRQLLAQGIQPIKVERGTTILATLAFLRSEIARPTTPWIVKALRVPNDRMPIVSIGWRRKTGRSKGVRRLAKP